MKKFSIAICVVVLIASAMPALALDMTQKSFYGAGSVMLPTGDFGDFAGTGFGGVVGVSVPHDAKMTFRGEAGYTMFAGKDFGTLEYSYNMIPILALVEYIFTPGSQFYGVGGAGLTNVGFEYDQPATAFSSAFNVSDSSMELTIVAGGGFKVDEKIAIEARYTIISDANTIVVVGKYNF
jgi:Outer membrane protein beta-barrel domain